MASTAATGAIIANAIDRHLIGRTQTHTAEVRLQLIAYLATSTKRVVQTFGATVMTGHALTQGRVGEVPNHTGIDATAIEQEGTSGTG